MVGAAAGLGSVARDRGDYAAARAHYEEGLALSREAGDASSDACLLGNLGSILRLRGELAAARALHEESLSLYRALGTGGASPGR